MIMVIKKRNLFIVGLILALIFCVEINILGWSQFNGILLQTEAQKPFPNQLTRLRINLEFIGLTSIYMLWLFQKGRETFDQFSKILATFSIFLVLPLLTYPRSTDVFQYLHYGLMGLNGANPYLNSADSFSSSLSLFLAWSQSSTYGPISQLFFMAAASTVKVSPLLGVYVFKLFCAAFHGINTYLIWRSLKHSPDRSTVTIAYFINPLLLTEYILSAHVDVFIANALILLILCLYRRHDWALVPIIWLGFLEKTLPVLWLPLVVVFLIRDRRWKELAISCLISLAIVFGLSQTALPTVAAWKSLINPGVSGQTALSFHYLLNATLSYLPNIPLQIQQSLLSILKLITYAGFAVYYLAVLLKIYLRRHYSAANLVIDLGWVTLVLLLFATPWLMPWYASILLPITALSRNSPLFVLTSFTFALSSNFIYGGAGSGISLFSMFSTLTVLLPPIAVLLLGTKWLSQQAVSKLSLNSNAINARS